MLRSHESATDSILTRHSHRTNFISNSETRSSRFLCIYICISLWCCVPLWVYLAKHFFFLLAMVVFIIIIIFVVCCWFVVCFFFAQNFFLFAIFKRVTTRPKPHSVSILFAIGLPSKTGYATTISISSCWMCTHLNSESNTHCNSSLHMDIQSQIGCYARQTIDLQRQRRKNEHTNWEREKRKKIAATT